jgi:hypothetical protein
MSHQHVPSSDGRPRSPSPALAWVRGHPYRLAAAVLFLGLAFPFLLRVDSEWDDVYVRAGRHLLAGDSIYNPNEGYVYPPVMAFVAAPFSRGAADVERLAWYVVSVLSLVLLIRWAWKLSGGGRLEGPRASRIGEHVVWALGLACGLRYAIDCLSHQQTDLLVGALVLGGCLALTRSRTALAATCLGVAAGVKCTPLLWCPFLAWRGHWRAALWLVCVAVGVNLLPDLVHRPPDGGTWLAEWASRHLAPMAGATYHPGRWFSEISYNQSLAGAANRWLTTTWAWTPAGLAVTNRPGAPSPGVLRWLLYPAELALLAAAGWAVGRHRRCDGRPADGAPPREAVTYSTVLLLMLLLSPMSSKPHFCTLFLPGFCVARRAVAANRPCRWLLGLAVAAGAVGTKGLWGGGVAALALWCGNVTWGALFLTAGCGYLLLQPPVRSVERSPALAPAA